MAAAAAVDNNRCGQSCAALKAAADDTDQSHMGSLSPEKALADVNGLVLDAETAEASCQPIDAETGTHRRFGR